MTPGPDGIVHVRYELSFSSDAFGDATYAPSTGPGHVHVAGAQWMLKIGDAKQVRRLTVEVAAPNAQWQVYSSIGPNAAHAETEAAYQNLGRSVLGGTSGGVFRFVAEGKPVSVFTAGGIAIPSAELADAVRRIVTAQRAAFHSADEFFHVIILPREGNVAGVASAHAFVTFLKPDIRREQLYMLLSHEMMHTWMSGDVFDVGPPDQPSENFVRDRWFIEGVNDYLAREVLKSVGLISERQFAELVNKDIVNLADNPHRAESFDEVMRAANAGKFDVAYTKLSYYRGGLIALSWAAKLRAAGSKKSLVTIMAELHGIASKRGPMSYDEFFGLLAKVGIDARSDFDRRIIRGEPIVPLFNALGARFVLHDTSVASFDAGYTVVGSGATRTISGVTSGSPAFRAGVRDGMRYVRAENATRFGGAWESEKPLVLTLETDGQQRRFEFMPHGRPLAVRLFREARGGAQ